MLARRHAGTEHTRHGARIGVGGGAAACGRLRGGSARGAAASELVLGSVLMGLLALAATVKPLLFSAMKAIAIPCAFTSPLGSPETVSELAHHDARCRTAAVQSVASLIPCRCEWGSVPWQSGNASGPKIAFNGSAMLRHYRGRGLTI